MSGVKAWGIYAVGLVASFATSCATFPATNASHDEQVQMMQAMQLANEQALLATQAAQMAEQMQQQSILNDQLTTQAIQTPP